MQARASEICRRSAERKWCPVRAVLRTRRTPRHLHVTDLASTHVLERCHQYLKPPWARAGWELRAPQLRSQTMIVAPLSSPPPKPSPVGTSAGRHESMRRECEHRISKPASQREWERARVALCSGAALPTDERAIGTIGACAHSQSSPRRPGHQQRAAPPDRGRLSQRWRVALGKAHQRKLTI